MAEAQHALTEALPGLHLESPLMQPLLPETQGAVGNRQRNATDLTATLAGLAAGMTHRKAGDQPADIPGVVAVVKMQDRLVAVVKRGLLDTLQAENFRVEVIVLLGVAHAECHVMMPLDVVIQTHLRCS